MQAAQFGLRLWGSHSRTAGRSHIGHCSGAAGRTLVPMFPYRYIATHIEQTIEIAGMKTTVDISDPLLRDARNVAAREGTTLRALVEQGLRQIVAAKKKRATAFRLRDVSFTGRGLRPELRDAGWERIRDLTYGYPSE